MDMRSQSGSKTKVIEVWISKRSANSNFYGVESFWGVVSCTPGHAGSGHATDRAGYRAVIPYADGSVEWDPDKNRDGVSG